MRLEEGGRADHGDRVHELVAAGFIEKRDVHDCERAAGRRLLGQEGSLGRADQGVHDPLQAAKSVGIVEDGLAESFAVNAVLRVAAVGKGRQNRGDRSAPLGEQFVDGGISIKHRNAERMEGAACRGFAHGDRAGEAEDEGHVGPPQPPSTEARSSAVTSGSTPNQAAKPGRP